MLQEHLSEPWFSLISLGIKQVEGRLNKGRFNALEVGDIIEWNNSDFLPRKCRTRIIRKSHYTDFITYLHTEGLERTLPAIPSINHGLSVYYKYFSQDEERQYGIVAFELELLQ